MSDAVSHPTHYTSHSSGVECIEVVESLPFNVGNAIKYLWRAGLKGPAAEDMRKALWYLRRECARLRAIGAYGSARPKAARVAALRAVAGCPEGVLRDVLTALLVPEGDHIVALELLAAIEIVQATVEAAESGRAA
jgi:hypothetical protein